MAALGLFAKRLLDQGKYIELYATLLAEDGFLRESDWESICGCDVLWHPMPAGPPRVAVRLGSGARGAQRQDGAGPGRRAQRPFPALVDRLPRKADT